MQTMKSYIGYSLPTPLLGLPLLDIPVAPWKQYIINSADEDYAVVRDSSLIVQQCTLVLYM